MADSDQKPRRGGFSLLEVVLAAGVLSLAVIALIGIVGPLLRGMADNQTSGELEAILATVRQWSTQAAMEDYAAIRGELRGGKDAYLYRLHSQTIDEAGWAVSDAGTFASDLSSASAVRFVRGPVACLLRLNSISQWADSYEPFAISVWIGGVPDPAVSVTDWSARLRNRAPDYTVRYVIHR